MAHTVVHPLSVMDLFLTMPVAISDAGSIVAVYGATPAAGRKVCENLQASCEQEKMRGGGFYAKDADDQNVRCVFRVKVNSTMLGDTVVIVGGHPALGAWDKSKAVQLSTSAAEFPWYFSLITHPLFA